MTDAQDQLDDSGVVSGGALDTWHLVVAYDGTAFHGWQVQPECRTVQGELQSRLSRLFRQPELRLFGTSRTDAGVHALDQNVSFRVPPTAGLDAESLRRTLNRWLPADMQVLAVRHAEPDFHARHSARGKAYTYVLHTGERCSPLFTRFAWHVPQALDVEAMRAAARRLEGEHDFASFAVNPGRALESTVRRLHRLELDRSGPFLCVTAVGTSFLYRMVRGLVGYLLHVGKGLASPADVERVLAACDRRASAESAPAHGLFLARVFFEAEAWRSWRPVVPPFAWPVQETLVAVAADRFT